METTKNHKLKHSKIPLFILALLVSGVVLFELFTIKHHPIAQRMEQYDSLKTSIDSKKALLIHTYLMGVAIYKEAMD